MQEDEQPSPLVMSVSSQVSPVSITEFEHLMQSAVEFVSETVAVDVKETRSVIGIL